EHERVPFDAAAYAAARHGFEARSGHGLDAAFARGVENRRGERGLAPPLEAPRAAHAPRPHRSRNPERAGAPFPLPRRGPKIPAGTGSSPPRSRLAASRSARASSSP